MKYTMTTTILITLLLSMNVYGESDTVCPSTHDGPSVGTIDTLIGPVAVTGVNLITDEVAAGPMCRLNGKPVLDKLSVDGLCSDVEVALRAPTCNSDDTRVFGYGLVSPLASSTCSALALDNGDIELLVNTIKGFSKRTWVPINDVGVYGPFTAGNTSTCKDSSGASSFYQSLHWLVPTTKGSDKTWSYSIRNDNCDVAVMAYGVLETDSTTMTNIYGAVSRPTISATSPAGTKTLRAIYTDEQTGGVQPDIVLGNPGSQASRVKVGAKKVLKGRTVNFIYNNGAFVPKGYWCLNGRTAVLRGTKGNCDAKCVYSGYGSYNGSKATQKSTKIPGLGRCPAYTEQDLRVVNGTRARTVNERGFFGAIAGLIEGAWSGMINGWFGVSSATEGVKGAASQESTQMAVDGINNGITTLTEKLNDKLVVIGNHMNHLEEEILELDAKVNDLRADVTSSQISTLVLLTNQGILDGHDRAVSELRRKLFAQLGPSATPTGDGCFKIVHKCNATCLDDLANNRFVAEKYVPLTWNVSSVIEAATETGVGGWRDPTLIAVAVVQLVTLTGGVVAILMMVKGRGGRCFC
uniref:Hemagglutinin n=1 Tax=Chum salmon influenza-like virus TaxID=2777032 RepID=A0A866VZX2_9ORTO|nr:hemagglutinin [Chum salmon influenza-like virus]